MQLAQSIDEVGLRSQALERVALQKVNKGQIDKDLEIAETLAHPDYIFAAAAVHAAAEDSREGAVDLLGKVEFPSAKVSALQAIAMSDFAAGKKDDAVALLTEAQQTATAIEHIDRYAAPSTVSSAGIFLAASSSSAFTAPFFSGCLAAPRRAADLALTVAQVVRTRYYSPPGMVHFSSAHPEGATLQG